MERVSIRLRTMEGQPADFRQEMTGYFESLEKRSDDKAKGKGVMGGSEGVLPVNSNVHYQEASF